MMADTETMNKLFLELSQFVTAKTARELKLEAEIERLRGADHERCCGSCGAIDDGVCLGCGGPIHTHSYWKPKPSENRTDLSKCPSCGGPADNGHSREDPPAPYYCSKCFDH